MINVNGLDYLKNKLAGAFDSAARRDRIIADLDEITSDNLKPTHPRFLQKTDSLMAYATRNPDDLEIIDPAIDKVACLLRESQGIRASGDFLLAARASLTYWNSSPEITDVYCAAHALDSKLSSLLTEDVRNSSPEKAERSQFFLKNWLGHYQSLKNQNMKGAVAAVIVDLCRENNPEISTSARLEAIKFVMTNPTTEFQDFLYAETFLGALAWEFESEGDAKGRDSCLKFSMSPEVLAITRKHVFNI